ncbi:hypothetical protein GCM10009119_13270 [Algoriphagus jejuensis]|uniref:Uncharacterized protein n=1 Tax=Algoriphagus jejuensis TaxID=419934 RepID=A0ABN1MY25_9BACT
MPLIVTNFSSEIGELAGSAAAERRVPVSCPQTVKPQKKQKVKNSEVSWEKGRRCIEVVDWDLLKD